MSAHKHTPAPWVLAFGERQTCHPGTTVAQVAPKFGAGPGGYWIFSNAETHGDQEADARLIAAAPELLEALKGVLAIVSDSRGVAGYHLNGDTAEWDEFDEVDAAIDAIAKATGEQP